MREIKFRYIVKDEFGKLHTIIKTLGQIAHSATERNFERNGCEIVARDEWTGLLDANGREIYEGDVCKFLEKYYDYPFTVVWDEDTCGFVMRGDNGFTSPMGKYFLAIDPEFVPEVIGNIYENAELVE